MTTATARPTALWASIAGTLREEIASGAYPSGAKLPTEADLSRRFGVNRHTVRRALADLAERGLVHSRRGSGTVVTGRPTEYAIGRRVRFHENLKAVGRVPGKRVHSVETRAATDEEADALDLPAGAMVHVCDGISLSNAEPIAVFRSIFPADGFAALPDILLEHGSVSRALAACGVTDFTRTSTRLSATTASATQAVHLNLREGAPVLQSKGVNVDPNGRPVEFGITIFAGDRVTLVFEPDG